MIARSGLTGNVFRKVVAKRRPLSRSAVLVYLVVAAGILAAYSATASAANYQNGALRSCPRSNSCTLNFPAPGGNLRIDYVTCRLLTNPAANAWVISVFNGTNAIFLNTQEQDAPSIRRSFTASNQIKYFVGAGPYTINALSGAFVDVQLACTVVGVLS